MQLSISTTPLGTRPFLGLGLETDGFIYDETNAKTGVRPSDIDRIEARLRAIRPAIARMFCYVDWFNPDLDGRTCRWDLPDYLNMVRMVRLLREIDTSVNIVLFQPMRVEETRYPLLADAMVELLMHLRRDEGLTNIRWLTLYNEPDSWFADDSDLWRRVFGEKAAAGRSTWTVYAALNRYAHTRLRETGLYPDVRLVVADTVWGARIRAERIRLAARDFSGLDVDYSYHNYNPEDPEYYRTAAPEYRYDGMAAEAADFRSVVGPAAPLVIWEFNLAGAGFSASFPGLAPGGVMVTERMEGGSEISAKVIGAVGAGVDGLCLWCFSDMIYCHDPSGRLMQFGLWRSVWDNWYPRPYYHYYAALCRALRPGTRIHAVSGTDGPVSAVAACGESATVALVNAGAKSAGVSIAVPASGEGWLQRIRPDLIPTEGDLPLDEWEECGAVRRRVTVRLNPFELAVWRSAAP